MSGFTADWLALRAPADGRARNRDVAARLSQAFAGRRGLRIVDLGAGTGANLTATAPLLPKPQDWRLVDHDPALLTRVAPPAGVAVEPVVADLAGGAAPLLEPPPDLVTASALFDLVGAAWLDGLAAAVAGTRAAVYVVLTLDGPQAWHGSHTLDAAVEAAFRADLARDKGLGPALGPDAHAALARALRAAGYEVVEGRSDWRLEAPRDAVLIAALAELTAAAVAPALGPRARDWAAARRAAPAVTVPHSDLLALPPGIGRTKNRS